MEPVNLPPALQQALDALERDLLRHPQHLPEATGALRRALMGLGGSRASLNTETLKALRGRCQRLAEMARLRLQTTARLQAALQPQSIESRTYTRRG